LDPLAELEADPDPAYADVDLEAGIPPSKYRDSMILTIALRYEFLEFFLEIGIQIENKIIFNNKIELQFFSHQTLLRDQI
jgi:hypothetical protein